MSPGFPLVTQEYSDREYWNERYAKSNGSCFDWYQRYDTLKLIINPLIPKDVPVLQVGVGNSRLQLDMAQEGYTSITSIDYAEAVIEQLQQSHQQYPQLQYEVADARDMPQFADSSYGAVLDKGTMDAMACGEHAVADIHDLLTESSRLLTPGGVFLGISYGSPKSRLQCFMSPDFGWDTVLYTIDRPNSTPGKGVSCTDGKQAVISGPLQPEEAMKLLDTDSDGVHYVYVCHRH